MWPPKYIKETYDIKWHPLITKPYLDFWDSVYEITKFKNILELGFNAGHTSDLILSKYDLDCLFSVDLAIQDYTIPCSDALKQKYDNFKFIKSNTSQYSHILSSINKKIDVVFIDTFHDFDSVVNDINLSLLVKPNYIVFDDLQFQTVRDAIESFNNLKKIISFPYLDCNYNNNIIELYKIEYDNTLI